MDSSIIAVDDHARVNDHPGTGEIITSCSLAHPQRQSDYLIQLQHQLAQCFLRQAPDCLSRKLELTGVALHLLDASITLSTQDDKQSGIQQRFSIAVTSEQGSSRKDTGFLFIGSHLLTSLFDRFFGGSGIIDDETQTVDREKPLTRAEKHLLQALIDRLLDAWQAIWHPLPTLQITVPDNQAYDNTPLEGRFLLTRYDVEMEGLEIGQFHIGMPMAILEPLAPGKSGVSSVSAKHWRQTLSDALAQTPVELCTILAEQTLPLKRIMAFRKDDIIPLSLQDTVVVKADSQPVFIARVGIGGGHLALEFLDGITAAGRQ